MAIADDIAAERGAVVESLTAAGPLAPTACGDWTALDLAAHLVSEERLGGVLTFVGRSLAVRGISPAARPEAVESFIRRERRHSFETLIDRLRRPTPWLLLRPQIAPVALFEFWTHHDDLTGPNGLVHPAPVTLAEVVPFLMRYQVKQLPAGMHDRPHQRRQPQLLCRPEIGCRGDPRGHISRPGAMALGSPTAGANRRDGSGCPRAGGTCLRRWRMIPLLPIGCGGTCTTRSETSQIPKNEPRHHPERRSGVHASATPAPKTPRIVLPGPIRRAGQAVPHQNGGGSSSVSVSGGAGPRWLGGGAVPK